MEHTHRATHITILYFTRVRSSPIISLVVQISDVPSHSNKCRQLQPQTLPQFLVSLYEYDPADETKDVFHEISIHRYV